MITTPPISTSTTESSVVIITGMYESGLTLAASLLEKTGWHSKGGRLDQSQASSDFLNFHESLLKRGKLETTCFCSEDVSQAQELISTHSDSSPWGWVDPRTTLVLDFWQQQLPQAKFILMYRSPWDVVDAMYYHFGDQFKTQLELPIQLWLTYNDKLLNFYRQNSENCFLSHGDYIAAQPHEWINAINKKISTSLQNSPDLEKILKFHSTLNKNRPKSYDHKSLVKTYFPEAIILYHQLNQENWKPIIEDNLQDNIEFLRKCQLQKWHQILQQEKQIQDCQFQFKNLQKELDLRMIQVYQTQQELVECKEKLKQKNEVVQIHKLRQKINKNKTVFDSYQSLVLDAWLAYRQNRLTDMVQLLRSSSQHRQLSKTERIMDWLKQFEQFSIMIGEPFDAQQLTHSPEWQQLVRHTVDA